MLRLSAALLLVIALFAAPTVLAGAPLSDARVRQEIIEQSIADYQATGHPCACPYNLARNGSSCGGRSAYSRPGGAAPLCYPSDVSGSMVADWRAEHPGQ